MINYTTPTITLTIEDQDITASQIYVTLKQREHKMTIDYTNLTATAVTVGQRTDTQIEFTLSQQQSAYFDYSLAVSVQVNWISSDGTRGATRIKKIDVMKNLLDEVKSYVN